MVRTTTVSNHLRSSNFSPSWTEMSHGYSFRIRLSWQGYWISPLARQYSILERDPIDHILSFAKRLLFLSFRTITHIHFAIGSDFKNPTFKNVLIKQIYLRQHDRTHRTSRPSQRYKVIKLCHYKNSKLTFGQSWNYPRLTGLVEDYFVLLLKTATLSTRTYFRLRTF